MKNVNKVRTALGVLYDEYVALGVEQSSNKGNMSGGISSSCPVPKSSVVTGFDQIMSLVRAKEAIP
ncbi:putative zinc finger BED domain-containing protein RICESLEEPER [Sesbania bispinosa]|nr:putative zinc finger BED domain-containing protein RICESLEEPER [Sesbania bispinosa]